MKSIRNLLMCTIAIMGISVLSGCLAVAAGAGAEAGYVASQDDRTAAETLEDQRITASVKSLLVANQNVSGFDINVDTFKSDVTLKGVLPNERARSEAIRVAKSVNGVDQVISKLYLE